MRAPTDQAPAGLAAPAPAGGSAGTTGHAGTDRADGATTTDRSGGPASTPATADTNGTSASNGTAVNGTTADTAGTTTEDGTSAPAPTVTIGADMSPELYEHVASALRDMGVEVRADEATASPREAKVIVVVSPKGGSGKTAISTNLAVALAERHPGRVVAVDLDVQFGNLPMALAMTPEHTLAQLTRTTSIDATSLKLHLTPHERDLFVLAGAADPVDADAIDHTHVSTVIPLLAANFDFVIVDTPAGLDERTLAALDHATDVLLVSSLDVSSIRSLRTATEALDQLGITGARRLVLNRADSKVGLEPGDAEAVMGMDIACSIPSSREIPLSLNLGTPVVVAEPKSPVARHLRELSALYSPIEAEPAKRRWFR